MPAWRDHPAADRAAIAQAVRALRATDAAEPELPAHLLPLGQRTYTANCQQCHGERGHGDGPAARELPVAPAGFHRQRPTLQESLRVLRMGIEGTSMAPWTSRLTDAELVAVAHYVRGFYAGADAPESGR
jgi:mono/diheme cytochrome c family protein